MDWWFDVDNVICCVRMDERKTPSSAVFEGDVRMRFDGVKLLRNGMTYIYRNDDGHCVSINDVKCRGERYVSLYCDDRLVKEYNVGEEKYREKYSAAQQLYDSPKTFFRIMTLSAAAVSVFCSCAVTAIMSIFGVFASLGAAAAIFALLSVMLAACITAVCAVRYEWTRAKLERYAVISAVKKPKKPRKKVLRRRAR